MALQVNRLQFVLSSWSRTCRSSHSWTRQLQVSSCRPIRLEGGPNYTLTVSRLTTDDFFSRVNYSTRQQVLPLTSRRRYSNDSSKPSSQDGGTEAGPSSSTASGESAASGKAASSTERIKVILREYGTVAFVFHISMSLCTLGTCYLLVSK